MKTSEFSQTQEVTWPLEEVFAFFAEPENLERITPPWLRFRIVSPLPIAMARGTLIDYRLRLKGVPIRWRTEITEWNPPYRFVDEQVRGPYRTWIHTHSFAPTESGTRISDHVEYAVPGGALIERFLVRPDLERIFKYRGEVIETLLAPD